MFGRRFLLCTTLAALLAVSACATGDDSDDIPTQPTTPPPTGPASLTTQDLVVGDGTTEAVDGKVVLIHYKLYHYDPAGTDSKGAIIQDSRTTGTGAPFQFTVGTTGTITGMSQGVNGMRVGGSRRIIIPPSLAYGAVGSSPNIRPNEWIVFEIDMLAVV